MANMQLIDTTIHAYIKDQMPTVSQYQEKAAWFSSPERRMVVEVFHCDSAEMEKLLICYNVVNHEISVFTVTKDPERWGPQ